MEIGGITRTLPVGDVGAARPQAPPPPDAVPTELPPDQAVQQPASASGLDGRHALDIESRRIVFEAIDDATGEVVYQIPDARALKAYIERREAEAAAKPEPGGLRLAI